MTVARVVVTAAVLVAYLGFSACAVTALQLGLDQMPDALSDNIISFIKWFIFSIIFGAWISEIILYPVLSYILTLSSFSLVSVQCLL